MKLRPSLANLNNNHPENDEFETHEIDREKAIQEAADRKTDPLDGDIPRRLKFVVKETGAVFEVKVRLYMVIGRVTNSRDRKVDIDLTPHARHEHGISRYHSYIQVVDDRISITDFNSTNGTYINGDLLRPSQPYRLRHGDNIRFGSLELKVLFIGFEGE